MSWLPGWNSIAGAGWWSNLYFGLSIAFLILLAVSQVASQYYGHRKDEMRSEQQDTTQHAHDKENMRLHRETARLTAEAEASRAQIAEANAKTAEAQRNLEALRRQISRRFPLTGKMVPLLKQATGTAEILYGEEDADSATVARIIGRTLEHAGWTVASLKGAPILNLLANKAGQGGWSVEARTLGDAPKNGVDLAFGSDRTDDRSPLTVLFAALYVGLPPTSGTGMIFPEDHSLPDGVFRVIILPR